MRIEYKGTPLEAIIERNKVLPIDFVYLTEEEFNAWWAEAEDNGILKDGSRDSWFTVIGPDIVFYLEH